MPELEVFDGKSVVSAGLSLNAGSGLAEAMKVDPQLLHQGDTVYVVIEATVQKIRYEPLKGDDSLMVRVHMLKAKTAAIIDGDAVKDALDRTRELAKRMREQEKGVQRLPTSDELAEQHALGLHAEGLVAGCPPCDAEVDATNAENNADLVPIAGRKRVGKK